MNYQIVFLQTCSMRHSGGNFAQELAQLLNINIDSAYRRIRGTTSLSLEEIRLICHKFKVSFDAIINYGEKLVPFQFNAMFREKFEILEYLQGIAQYMQEMGEEEGSQIILSAMDIPYFRLFGFKNLSRFKLFFWQKSVLNLDEYRYRKFNVEEVMEDFEEITYEIHRHYHNINSVEIWSTETMESTIKQVQYYYDSGLFESKKSALAICEDLHLLLDKLEHEAQLGTKTLIQDGIVYESKLSMYQSDLFLSNNCIQAIRQEKIYTYISFNSFNTMMTYHPEFSVECQKWIGQIRSKAVLLSEVSEKLRYQYLLTMKNKLNQLVDSLSD